MNFDMNEHIVFYLSFLTLCLLSKAFMHTSLAPSHLTTFTLFLRSLVKREVNITFSTDKLLDPILRQSIG